MWVELTGAKSSDKILVNTSLIEAIVSTLQGTELCMTSKIGIVVAETFGEIKALLSPTFVAKRPD